MSESEDGGARESELFAQRIDPIAQDVLDAAEPWTAYRAANGIPDALIDDLEWLPHGGGMYKAWAELTDLFETGKTPIADAYAALQQAASEWLNRSGLPTEPFIETWLERAMNAARALFKRDGDFWRPPK